MTVRFEVETIIDAPVDRVFDLSLDIDAHRASMSASNERAVGGVTTGRIELGEHVAWRATHFGIPFTMTSAITELDRPTRFVDVQKRGPFRSFRHEHLFERRAGRTVMVDRIEFQAPLGASGRVVERIVLGRYLRQLIEVRNSFLETEAEVSA